MNASVTFYHTCDMHHHMAAVNKLQSMDSARSAFLVDSGDALRGSSTMVYGREPILEKMNRAAYDAMALGNREFHYCRSVLYGRIAAADFPIFSSNVEDCRCPGRIIRYVIVKKRGVSVAFAALTPIQYEDGSLWSRLFRFQFRPYAASLREVLALDPVKNCDLKVVLSHAGLEEDLKLAAAGLEMDLILGGHSHKALDPPRIVNGIPVCNSGCYGKYIGKYEMTPGRPGSFRGQLMPVT